MDLRRPSAALLLAALLAAGCASTSAGPAGVSASPRLEVRAFSETNRVRRAAGLADLEMRLDLARVARGHAEDMALRGYFSHYTPEGAGPGDRARREGVRFRAYAENLARVRGTGRPVSLAVRGWLESPGHRRNLLDEGRAGYRYTGIGAVEGPDGTVHLAQVFLR